MPHEPLEQVRVQRAVLQFLHILLEEGSEGHPHVGGGGGVWRQGTAPDEQGRGGKVEASQESSSYSMKSGADAWVSVLVCHLLAV